MRDLREIQAASQYFGSDGDLFKPDDQGDLSLRWDRSGMDSPRLWRLEFPVAACARGAACESSPGMERLLRMLHAATRMEEREIDTDFELISLSFAHLPRVVRHCQDLFDEAQIANTVAHTLKLF